MKYTVIPAGELSPDLTARWAAIQEADPSLGSPYFRPEFTQAVAAVRDDAFVGILEDSDGIIGFFPFHRRRSRVAQPIGLGLSDHHGVVAKPDAQWNAEALLHGCNLVRWDFDHLIADQRQFAPYHLSIADSPIIRLSGGMEAFEASRDSSGRKQLREVERKREKLSRQAGPITFTAHTSRPEILRQLMRWKSEQCRRSGTVDYFALGWCVQLVERIHKTRGPRFGGTLISLHAGDTLAAVHFAMYSDRVWHSWFPAYNRELDAHSPGLILLIEMIRSAAQQGVAYIDLGKGVSLYKQRVMTGTIPVASGRVQLPALRNRLLNLRESAEDWGRRSPLRPLLRVPGRFIRNQERKRRYG